MKKVFLHILGVFLWTIPFILVEFLIGLKYGQPYKSGYIYFIIGSLLNILFFTISLTIIFQSIKKWILKVIQQKPIILICFLILLFSIFLIPAEQYYNTSKYKTPSIIDLWSEQYGEPASLFGIMLALYSLLIMFIRIFTPNEFLLQNALSLRQHKKRWLLAFLIPLIFPIPFLSLFFGSTNPGPIGIVPLPIPGIVFFIAAIINVNLFIIFLFIQSVIILYLFFIFLSIIRSFILEKMQNYRKHSQILQ